MLTPRYMRMELIMGVSIFVFMLIAVVGGVMIFARLQSHIVENTAKVNANGEVLKVLTNIEQIDMQTSKDMHDIIMDLRRDLTACKEAALRTH